MVFKFVTVINMPIKLYLAKLQPILPRGYSLVVEP
jgi:hypothetical protein